MDLMTDGLPSFPYHPYDIADDNGRVDPTPTPKGVVTVDHSRKLAKDITKLARVKIKTPKARMKKKLDVKWY